mmetsp:Transcript_63742/g.151959  ORF Transcript_63742/g.151959 Transcript_63742/m.151959 type:complete len:436 (+) Transcript_63742:95-1402(+)
MTSTAPVLGGNPTPAWAAPAEPVVKRTVSPPPAARLVSSSSPRTSAPPLRAASTARGGGAISPEPLVTAARNPLFDSPVTLYRDTLEGFLKRLQVEITDLSVAILEERHTRNPKKWSIQAERDSRRRVDGKLTVLKDLLQACMSRFAGQHNWPSTDLRAALERVESRRNIQVDLLSGNVQILKQLHFKPRSGLEGPVAEFQEPAVADAVCRDLAEVAQIFDCQVIVQGHTKGHGEGEFSQALADNRAQLVAEKISERGVDAAKIFMEGLPGRMGLNVPKATVSLQLPSLQGQPMYTWPRERVVLVTNPQEVLQEVAPTPPPAPGPPLQPLITASSGPLQSQPSVVLTSPPTVNSTPRSSPLPPRCQNRMATSSSPPRISTRQTLGCMSPSSESPLRSSILAQQPLTAALPNGAFSPGIPVPGDTLPRQISSVFVR